MTGGTTGAPSARLALDRVAAHVPGTVEEYGGRGGAPAREAAVLAPVIDRPDGHHLLFAKRAEDLDEHPGQMAFPGGGREPEDEDLRATAVREAGEEVNVAPEEVRIVGRLDAIRTVTDYAVTPFLARVPDRTYVPDGREVTEAVVLPVAGLTDPENHEAERREHPTGGQVVVHYFRVDGYTVWGATGRILVGLLELATDWRAPDPADPDR